MERLIHGPTIFATCAYNFKEDRIDFFTSKDSDFGDIVWDSMKASMTIHEKHGVWIRGYQRTDAELVPYKMYENMPFTKGYKSLIISNHYDQGEGRAEHFVNDPSNVNEVKVFKDRAAYLEHLAKTISAPPSQLITPNKIAE